MIRLACEVLVALLCVVAATWRATRRAADRLSVVTMLMARQSEQEAGQAAAARVVAAGGQTVAPAPARPVLLDPDTPIDSLPDDFAGEPHRPVPGCCQDCTTELALQDEAEQVTR